MRVAICGAGIAGLALAYYLQRAGVEVVVLEKAPGPRTQGYMIDFFGPGYEAAETTGLLPRLRERGYQVDEWSYVDERGRRRAGMSFERFARAVDGRLLSIMRPDLERVVREQVEGTVDLRFGCAVTEVTDTGDGVRVTLADGGSLSADLLVGADGIHSTVRRLVFGAEERYLRYLGFHTAAYTFDDPESHAEVADRFFLTDTVDRQMGFYGLGDGRVAVFTVHRTPDPTLPADSRAALRREYGSLGWIAPRALERCPDPSEVYYDQVAQIRIPRWSDGRVVLLGDSCGAVSLLAGQGASLAVGGAYVLARQLAAADSVEAALAGYEEQWRPVVAEKQEVALRLVRWFLPASAPQLWARRVMLGMSGLLGLDGLVAGAVSGKSGLPRESVEPVGR